MTALLLLVAAPCLAVAVFIVAEMLTVSARQREASLQRLSRYGRRRRTFSFAPTPAPFVDALARLALRLRPRTEVDAIALELRAAGLGKRVSVESFLAVRVAATAVGAGAGALEAISADPFAGGVLAAALAGLGYLGPAFLIRLLARKRRARIGPALPDALDLLCVCIQAGLGLEAAIKKLTEEMDGPLADELELVLGEIRIGVSRQEALEKLAARANVPELRVVVRALVLAERQGSSLGRTLAVQAAEARERRRVAAEDEANKAPVKMLFPTALFLFPALFVVVLGPALLTIGDSF